MAAFQRKTYGGIFVIQQSHVEKVREIIRKLDEYEYEQYLPEKFIQVLDSDYSNFASYGHKFDSIDMDVLAFECLKAGVIVLILTGKREYFRVKDLSWLKKENENE